MKSCVVASMHLSGNAWEKAHELQEREEFSAGWAVTARCCSQQMAFPPFSQRAAGPTRNTFAPKYHNFVVPLLHSLKPFTIEPDVSAVPVLCCNTFSCQMHPAAKQLCEDQPRNLEWSWQLNTPLGCKVNMIAATVKHGQGSYLFFLLRAGVVSMVVFPALQMHLLAQLCFLVPPGFFKIRLIYILKLREELSLCHANPSGWLSWKCLALIWWCSWSFQNLHSAHRRQEVCQFF